MKVMIVGGGQLSARLEAHLSQKQTQVVRQEADESAVRAIAEAQPDVVYVAVGGPEFVASLRSNAVDTPAIVAYDVNDPTLKAKALRSGADDSFGPEVCVEEAAARLNAVVRRASHHQRNIHKSVFSVGPLTVDTESKSAVLAGGNLPLTTKEFAILEHLMERKGGVVSKGGLLAALYNGLDTPDSKIIDVFICKLRKKISERTGGDQTIKTAWGAGYYIEWAPQNETRAMAS